MTRGLIAARRGQSETATAALRHGMDLLRFSGEPEYFFAAEALARIASARGDHDRSIRVLSEAVAEPAHTYAPSQWTGGYWIRLTSQLAGMHQRAGRHEQASRIRDSLQKILAAEIVEERTTQLPEAKGILPASTER